MRFASLVIFALTVSAGVASAEQPAARADANGAARQVFMCERSAETSRSWLRDCATSSADRPAAVKVARRVFVCDRTAATRKAWMREYGEMTFITADEFARAEASNEAWAMPRCMTKSELRRVAKTAPGTDMARALSSTSSL